MKTLWSWCIFIALLGWYMLSRTGWVRRPTFLPYEAPVYRVAGQLFGWKKRVRVVQAHHCPADGPVLFCANHLHLMDPLDLWAAIYWSMTPNKVPAFIMRDDFFKGPLWDYLPIHPNHLCEMCGNYLISRDEVKLAQLRPILKHLADSGAVGMFPGRTRSRTGAWFEYREDRVTPGSPAFLITITRRRFPGEPITVTPVARTWHPIRKSAAIVFGPALYLAEEADRMVQQAFDDTVLTAIGDLVEIHGLHLVGALLWMHVLHYGETPISTPALRKAITNWTGGSHTHPVHPALIEKPEEEIAPAVDYLARRRFLRREGDLLYPNAALIRADIPWDEQYEKKNPVKYYSNQLIHLAAVTAWVESTVLSRCLSGGKA